MALAATLLASLSATPSPCASGDIQSFIRGANGVTQHSKDGALRIEFCSDRIVHVVASPTREITTVVVPTMIGQCIGSEAEPMSIGWHPSFSIPSGDRKQAQLQIPASRPAEVNNYDDVFPTGKLLQVSGTKYDFRAPGGRPLNDIYLDDFSGFSHAGGAVVVSLTDPASNYGIHVEGLSPEIRTLQVYAPPEKAFAVVEDQFNFADPFGNTWEGMDTGMVTLQPNQTVIWRVRLELFTPEKESSYLGSRRLRGTKRKELPVEEYSSRNSYVEAADATL